jgi:CDGSH-type Zn-finger protein
MTAPVCPQKAPYPVLVKAGDTVWWCACGRSAAQPFCDGSHAGTGIEPVPYTVTTDRTVWFCGCKATRQAPHCDGSHKTS